MKQLWKSITQQITDSAKKNTMAINIYMTFSINQQSGGRLYIGYAYNQL